MNEKKFHFDFDVYGITREQAEGLLDSIIIILNVINASPAGGFTIEDAEADDEQA